jgi:polynucleotide 5'-hydroxyl-kinase GRC3/NOL9
LISPGAPADRLDLQSIDLPADWGEAIAAILAQDAHCVLIAGEADCGKSSFARALLARSAAAGREVLLLDADPGQKMAGPPGAVTLAQPSASGGLALTGLAFVGSVSAADQGPLLAAVSRLRAEAGGQRLVVNTGGFVHGSGLSMLLRIATQLQPDRIVAIDAAPDLRLRLGRTGACLIVLSRSPAARRKTRAVRARNRQEAFCQYLGCAVPIGLDWRKLAMVLPVGFTGRPDLHPVCALAGADGRDLSIGVLTEADEERAIVVAPPPDAPVAALRFGRLWAGRSPEGWRLLEGLPPAPVWGDVAG